MNIQSAIRSDKPFALMGVVNVTPDSFYDGGRYVSVEAAVEQALKLGDEGADIIDIGGASSRPGAVRISSEEEVRRVVPVIKRLAGQFNGLISIDTTWSHVAEAALDAGAAWINDISSGRFDPGIITLAAKRGCNVVLMHSRRTPETMQLDPEYDDVVSEVKQELFKACGRFLEAGVLKEKIILDPGIGFAKTAEHNLVLIRELQAFTELGYPVLIGTSRKSFIGHITGREPDERLFGTLGTVASAYLRGARIFRVHDIRETGDFLKVFSVVEDALPIGYYKRFRKQ